MIKYNSDVQVTGSGKKFKVLVLHSDGYGTLRYYHKGRWYNEDELTVLKERHNVTKGGKRDKVTPIK